MSVESRFFCSELSRRSSEETFGTASIGAVWFLLEYPHGWGAHALRDSALSDRVKRFFADATARIKNSRVLFIKTDRARREARMNFFVVRCREREPFAVRLSVESYDDLTRFDLASIAHGEELQGGLLTREPLFLVCTHGRRDKCCAKFGVAVYNSLRGHAGDAAWQSSHVGGDRFAANVLCFPHGLFYAHADDSSARRIADEYRRGRVVNEKFRGRACYSHFVQAAEFFVRKQSGVAGVEDLPFHSSSRVDGSTWRVRFTQKDTRRRHEAFVRRFISDIANPLTCHSEEATSVPQFRLEDYRISDD
ncbi:MAG TPA: sucrase ferredoxin [Pyrinomonadaceae bacterium]|nr:sucrase ferredoxin [Pyrinomonadaceae bacterium]